MEYDEFELGIQGEIPADVSSEHITQHLDDSFNSADQLGGAGFERFSYIRDHEGNVHELRPGDFSFEPAEERGHFLLHAKEKLSEHKKGAAVVATVVTAAAVYRAAKAIRERKK